MEQLLGRFKRSPEAGLEARMKELLDHFKAEVLVKFQEQEEKNTEQDLKIARQNEIISKLEETIAEQQKNIEEQIAIHPDFGNDKHHLAHRCSLTLLSSDRHSVRGSLHPPRESSLHHGTLQRFQQRAVHRDLSQHQRMLPTTSAMGKIRAHYVRDI